MLFRSTQAVDTATVVKLFRVMLLMPVVLGISILYRKQQVEVTDKPATLVPGFLLAFIVLVLLSSQQLIPASVIAFSSDSSRACLVLAIAAAGVKTDFADLIKLGWAPLVMLVAETLWIAGLIGVSYPFWAALTCV